MKRSNVITLGVMLLIFFLSTATFAQSKKKKSESEKFTERLWYSGSIGMGMSSRSFTLLLSPMVGYKLTDKFSLGIRTPLDYDYDKLTTTEGNIKTYNNLNLGLGVFGRHKIFKGFFAHAEYNYLWEKNPLTSNGFALLDPEDPSRFLTSKNNRDELNIGFGYATKGRFGAEIMLLYNVLDDVNTLGNPWSIRFGFNYKF